MNVSSIMNRNSYQNLATGYKINSAADDAAGLAISEKMLSQINGYDMGTKNAQDGQNMINVAEGGLSGMNDSLLRIRELAVQASNGIYTDDDKANIQIEIDQLKASITDQAKGTQFNTLKLLDGSMGTMDLATNPKGTGMSIQMVNATLEKLGLSDFDVTKEFSIDTIDKAINDVSSARSNLGASSNRLDHTISSNMNASINLTSARSQISDTDYAKEVTNLSIKRILNEYTYFAQKQQSQAKCGLLSLFN